MHPSCAPTLLYGSESEDGSPQKRPRNIQARDSDVEDPTCAPTLLYGSESEDGSPVKRPSRRGAPNMALVLDESDINVGDDNKAHNETNGSGVDGEEQVAAAKVDSTDDEDQKSSNVIYLFTNYQFSTSFQYLKPFNLTTVCFCCCVVSLISSPFRRLYQADHIGEGKARPQHQELHSLLFTNSVWVVLRPTELGTFKVCDMGSTVYSPYLRRLLLSYFRTLSVGLAGVDLPQGKPLLNQLSHWSTVKIIITIMTMLIN